MSEDGLEKCLEMLKEIKSKYGVNCSIETKYTQYGDCQVCDIILWVEGVINKAFESYYAILKRRDMIVACIEMSFQVADCQAKLNEMIAQL